MFFSDDDLQDLARRFTLSGGDITNAAVAAIFDAANEASEAQRVSVRAKHLAPAIAAEYRKAGRTLAPGDFGPDLYRLAVGL